MAITGVRSGGPPPTFQPEEFADGTEEELPDEEASEHASAGRLDATMRIALMAMEQSQKSETQRDEEALSARDRMINAQEEELRHLKRAAQRKKEGAMAGAVVAGVGGVVRVGTDIAAANAASTASACNAWKDAAKNMGDEKLVNDATIAASRAERLKAGITTTGAASGALETVANKVVETTIGDAEEKARIAAKDASNRAERAKTDEQRTHDAAQDAGRSQDAMLEQLRAILAQEHDAKMRIIPA